MLNKLYDVKVISKVLPSLVYTAKTILLFFHATYGINFIKQTDIDILFAEVKLQAPLAYRKWRL